MTFVGKNYSIEEKLIAVNVLQQTQLGSSLVRSGNFTSLPFCDYFYNGFAGDAYRQKYHKLCELSRRNFYNFHYFFTLLERASCHFLKSHICLLTNVKNSRFAIQYIKNATKKALLIGNPSDVAIIVLKTQFYTT